MFDPQRQKTGAGVGGQLTIHRGTRYLAVVEAKEGSHLDQAR